MRRLMKKILLLKREDSAVAGVVVAVMIVGLVLAVISIIQAMYVPKWMEQIESEHMDDVNNEFGMLKYAIDTQLLAQQDTPLTTPITLGSKELPFLVSSKAFGNLAVLENKFSIHIDYNNTEYADKQMGIIKYSSENSYYIDQSYIYEAGAIILVQSQGGVMSMTPSFSVTHVKGEIDCKLSFNITNIISKGGKTTIGGFGTYPIQTQWTESNWVVHSPNPPPLENIQSITITSAYSDVWSSYFRRTLKNSDLIDESEDHDNGNFYIDDQTVPGEITIYFEHDVDPNIIQIDDQKVVSFYLKIHDINVQIAPGWVN